MRGINKKTIMALGACILLSTPVATSARDIKTLTNFKLPAYMGVNYMPSALKSATGGATIINLGTIDGQGTGSYAIDGVLENSDGLQRGDYTPGIMENKRTAIINFSSAKAGYYYKFRCMNHNSVSLNAYVSGSWSPDAN